MPGRLHDSAAAAVFLWIVGRVDEHLLPVDPVSTLFTVPGEVALVDRNHSQSLPLPTTIFKHEHKSTSIFEAGKQEEDYIVLHTVPSYYVSKIFFDSQKLKTPQILFMFFYLVIVFAAAE